MKGAIGLQQKKPSCVTRKLIQKGSKASIVEPQELKRPQ